MSILRAFRTELATVAVVVVLAAIGVTKPTVQPVQVNLIGAGPKPVVQTTVYSADWCAPCGKYVKAIREVLPPLGWMVRNAQDKDADQADIIIDKDDKTSVDKYGLEVLPTTIIRKNGQEVKRIPGRISADELSNIINSISQSP